MMVLSAEDAVSKLREVMGPTDPEVAKETHPESLRSVYHFRHRPYSTEKQDIPCS